jgi:hypothetical protein
MNFSLYTDYGALNSPPIFQAFANGVKALGHDVSYNNDDADVAVIWSVLWDGRMRPNEAVWQNYRNSGRNVIVIEVGTLFRSITWRIGINGINREANFGLTGNDDSRVKKFKIGLQENRSNPNGPILICTQSPKSRQWRNELPMNTWVKYVIKGIRKQTDRDIIVRPHPRYPVEMVQEKNVTYQQPNHIKNDVWDLKTKDAFAVINLSSGPGVQATLWGTPAYVGKESLAYEIANEIGGDYNNPKMPTMEEKQQWLNDLTYTEWTVEEINKGIPLERLLQFL